MKTINVTPSWQSLFPIFKDMIFYGTAGQKEYVCEELEKLCKVAGAYNKLNKGKNK